MKNKKAMSASSMVGLTIGFVMLIIAVVVLFNIFGNTSANVTTAMTTASNSGLPLAGVLYSSTTGAAAYLWVLVPFILIVGAIVMAVKHYSK